MASPKRKVVMIEGDGIGPEVCEAVRTVLAATDAPIEWVMAEAGLGALERTGTPLPDATVALLKEHGVGIKGPTMTPTGEGHRSVNVRLREELGLFAGVRPVRTIEGVHHPLAGLDRKVDLVVIRENLEDLYVGFEHDGRDHPQHIAWGIPNDAKIALKVITPERTRNIVHFAFLYSRSHGRRKVTCVHKANILKQTDGMFLRIFREIAEMCPDIVADDFIVDAAAMRLVRNPEQFDVLVCPNLYGDILSDLCAALVGGLGVVPGANIGHKCALFEAVHGTAPDIAGQSKANPTALLLSACMMLDHLAETKVADRLERSIVEQIQFGASTPDIGGSSTTMQVAEAIAHQYRVLAEHEDRKE